MNKTKKLYKAELEPVDFKTSSEEARLKINCWVEKQTQGASYTVKYPPKKNFEICCNRWNITSMFLNNGLMSGSSLCAETDGFSY